MPGMRDDLCREIKADPLLRETPVLMITSAGREEERARCEEAGCDGILTKPINRHLFLAAVRGRLSVVERGAHRVPARLQVRFGTHGGRVLTDFSVNVSTGGVFIETAQRFAVGEPLRTTFVLPDREQPVTCSSRVAWVNTAERPTDPFPAPRHRPPVPPPRRGGPRGDPGVREGEAPLPALVRGRVPRAVQRPRRCTPPPVIGTKRTGTTLRRSTPATVFVQTTSSWSNEPEREHQPPPGLELVEERLRDVLRAPR